MSRTFLFSRSCPWLLTLSCLLGACGGGGGASPTSVAANQTTTGIFLDSAVAGISYQTLSIDGTLSKWLTTNAKGQFYFAPQDKITFAIGDIQFPQTDAAFVVTPLSISGKTDLGDPSVANMAYLLQSLDSDADPSNGIAIHSQMLEYAKGKKIDFTAAPTAFAADITVKDLIRYQQTLTGKPSTTTLDSAADHLGQTLLGMIDTQSLPNSGCTSNSSQSSTSNQGLVMKALSRNMWADMLAKPVNEFDWFYDSVFKPLGASPQGDFIWYQPASTSPEMAAAKISDHWFDDYSAEHDVWLQHRQNTHVILRIAAKKNSQENANLPAYSGSAIYLHYIGPQGSHLEFEFEPGSTTTVFLSFVGSNAKTKYTGTAGKDGVLNTGDDGVLSPTVGGSQWAGHQPGETNFPKNLHIGATTATGRQLPSTSCGLKSGGSVLLWTRPSSATDLFFSPNSGLNRWNTAAPLYTAAQGYQGAAGIRSGVRYLNVYTAPTTAP